MFSLEVQYFNCSLQRWVGEQTVRHTGRCHSPPDCSANSTIRFYRVAVALNAHLICEMFGSHCVSWALISAGSDGVTVVFAVLLLLHFFFQYLFPVQTACSFSHCKELICCRGKKKQQKHHNAICQIDWKFDSALSVFSLWQPTVSISHDHTVVHIVLLIYKWLITAMRHPVTLIYTNHTLPLWLLLNRINAGANVSGSGTRKA